MSIQFFLFLLFSDEHNGPHGALFLLGIQVLI